MKPILHIKHLEKRFVLHHLNGKEIIALHDINLRVLPGEIIGLIGKSGAGKSTLMKCIYRTYLSSDGSIEYLTQEGKVVDLVTANDYEVLAVRKSEMTYCSQFLSVIPRISALNVVADHAIARGMHEEKALEKAANFLDRMGLPKTLWDTFPSTFSGGEQQRVNVARAIIAQPRLLLIDEPTASLDRKTKDVVIDLILELKQLGTTVLVISHDAYTLERMCDRKVALKDGHLIGNH